MALTRDGNELNNIALKYLIDLYSNENSKGWSYALRSMECLANQNAEGKYKVLKSINGDNTIMDIQIEKFLNTIDNATDITPANDSHYRYFEICKELDLVKFRINFSRLINEIRACGLSRMEINKLSLKDIVLIGSCLATVDNDVVTPHLEKPLRLANQNFSKLTNATNLVARKVIASLELAQNKMIKGKKIFYEYVANNFIRLKINPPGIMINHEDNHRIQTGFHSQGLPFQINIQMNEDNKCETFQFLHLHILTLIDFYAEALSQHENPKKIIEDFYHEMEKLKNVLNFNFINLMISYQRNHQIFSIDFSFLTNDLNHDSLESAITFASTNIQPVLHSRGDDFGELELIPTEKEQRKLQEKIYHQEYARLALVTNQHKDSPCGHIQEIATKLKRIEDLRKDQPSENLVSLTRNISSVSRAIHNPTEKNCKNLVNRGLKEESKSDLWKSLGKIMKNIGRVILGFNTIAGSFVFGAITGVDTEKYIDMGFDWYEKGMSFFSGSRQENQKALCESMGELSRKMKI